MIWEAYLKFQMPKYAKNDNLTFWLILMNPKWDGGHATYVGS